MILSQTPQTAKTKIRFDRPTKQWQAVNGTVQTFPTKREALLAALVIDRPAISQIVTDLGRMENDTPAVIDRLIRAVKIILNNQVGFMSVQSATEPKTYKITWDGTPKRYGCTCPDFDNGSPDSLNLGGKVCKHILAHHISYLMGMGSVEEEL